MDTDRAIKSIERSNKLISAKEAREVTKSTIDKDHVVLRHVTNEIFNAALSGWVHVNITKSDFLGVSLPAVCAHLDDLGFSIRNLDKEIEVSWRLR
jgi:hypothetical protein